MSPTIVWRTNPEELYSKAKSGKEQKLIIQELTLFHCHTTNLALYAEENVKSIIETGSSKYNIELKIEEIPKEEQD
jgi:hypothetical protein